MRTFGPRFSGGYQFPRTHAAPLTRGEPICKEKLPNGSTVAVVPLTGGRRRLFDVCAQYLEGETWVSHSFIAGDELEAKSAFLQLIQKAKR